MSDDRWRRIENHYHDALRLPPEQRAAFLEDTSRGDSELRREVESLLAEHRSKDSVFDQPAWKDLSPGGQSASRSEALLGSGAVLGPYRIAGLLGAGGMGQVYRAHDSRLHRSVAIKVMFPGQDARRFATEARAVAALSHPNVVPIFDVGHDSGVDYLVEELVDGESLRELLRRGPLAVARFRHLSVQIADGLAAAHRAGIIHRDLKPANIMVSRQDCARILDFGLATSGRAGSDEASISLSHSGPVVGTAAYMSPEQVQGGMIDTRSDIFSYGALLYEMIAGRRASQSGADHSQVLVQGPERPVSGDRRCKDRDRQSAGRNQAQGCRPPATGRTFAGPGRSVHRIPGRASLRRGGWDWTGGGWLVVLRPQTARADQQGHRGSR